MHTLKEYKSIFMDYMHTQMMREEPQGLYDPIAYILNMNGKRLRPVLTLMTTDIFGAKNDIAWPAAMAIELFHNFTLMHDDIMDNAPLRRGQQTVHEKWNINTGILSGDAMFIIANQFLAHYPPRVFKTLSVLFHDTAIKVCEGQQYDVDFESRHDVTIAEYLKMIEYKTAILIAVAMKMGAIIASASSEQATAIYNFGLHLGIAFQLKDDYLDTFGKPEDFGKRLGGDIIANKKTFLYVKALENSDKKAAAQLQQLYAKNPIDVAEKVACVKDIFTASKADLNTLKEIQQYTTEAYRFLDDLKMEQHAKATLQNFAENLMNRTV